MAKAENRGDFIALIRNSTAEGAAAAAVARANVDGLRALDVGIPAGMEFATIMGTLGRSDHASFWYLGYPAMMITDTAEFRNEGYHCGATADTIDRLDHAFATQVIRSTVAMVAAALKADGLPALTPPKPACDAAGTDAATTGCKASETCALRWANSSVLPEPTCLPLAASVSAVGEHCERPKNVVGEDTCAAGAFCTFWGEPMAEPQPRRCLAVCHADADCTANGACVGLSARLLSTGLCMERCAFDDEKACGAGRKCTVRGGANGMPSAVCDRAGSTPVGADCKYSEDCIPGAHCSLGGASGKRICRATCGPKRACPSGESCELYNGLDVGVCTEAPSLSLAP